MHPLALDAVLQVPGPCLGRLAGAPFGVQLLAQLVGAVRLAADARLDGDIVIVQAAHIGVVGLAAVQDHFHGRTVVDDDLFVGHDRPLRRRNRATGSST